MDLYFLWFFFPIPLFIHLFLLTFVQRSLKGPTQPNETGVWVASGFFTSCGVIGLSAFLLPFLFPLLRLCGSSLEVIEPFGWLALLGAVFLTFTLLQLSHTLERRTVLILASSSAAVLCIGLFLRVFANLDIEACKLNP